jgi:MATE family multidrug resistance protein
MLLKERDYQILRIALPAIITNVTVPLLGLVDTAIVGHMGDAAYIGAIAVGAMIFNLVYWVFGFLRMGTSGMTAQAWGRKDFAEIQQMLTHSLALSTLTSLLLLVLQWPLCQLMLAIIGPSADVRPLAHREQAGNRVNR